MCLGGSFGVRRLRALPRGWGCGGVNIARPFGGVQRELRLLNDIDALPGIR
jgi:hypothetical protein